MLVLIKMVVKGFSNNVSSLKKQVDLLNDLDKFWR